MAIEYTRTRDKDVSIDLNLGDNAIFEEDEDGNITVIVKDEKGLSAEEITRIDGIMAGRGFTKR